jgi:hypothetical protein
VSADDARRCEALVSSIVLWLGTMSLEEVQRVDERVMEVLRARDVEEWARHDGEERWHFIAEDDQHSIITGCNGRWSLTDRFERSARPARADRCYPCQRAFELRNQRQLVENGLLELAKVAPEETAIDDLFDTGGEG